MKINKLLSVFAVSALALANLSAFEAKAKVTMEGTFVKETKNKDEDANYEVFALDALDDRSKNGVEIDVDAGAAGAHFEVFYQLGYNGGTVSSKKAEEGWEVSARNTHLWFKPIDQVKIRLGYVGIKDFFVERIDDEKVGNPFSIYYRQYYHNAGKTNYYYMPYYITNADVDEMGFGMAVTPIENLTVSGAIAPGIDNAGFTFKGGKNAFASWGVTAAYSLDALKFQAAYRDNGKENWKVIRLGAGYESDNIYAFIQPVFGIDYIATKDKYEMNGTCIDLYGEYTLDALKFTGHLPITFRTTGKDNDPKYLEFLAKVEYNTGAHGLLDDVTPYFLARNMDYTVIALDDKASDYLALTFQAGTSFKVSSAKIDIGFRIDVHSEKSYATYPVATDNTSERVTWLIPFKAKIEF